VTCIVGLKHNGRVYLGGDSCITYGWDEKRVLAVPKVVRWNDFLLGSCGDHRMSQLVEYDLKIERQLAGQNDLHYLVTVFASGMRKLLKEQGYSEIENNKESASGQYLVGYRGELYRIGPDFSAVNHADTFDAIGVGAAYALGALATLENSDLSPKKKIKLALRAATRFSNGVDDRYTIISEKAKKQSKVQKNDKNQPERG